MALNGRKMIENCSSNIKLNRNKIKKMKNKAKEKRVKYTKTFYCFASL